MTQGNFIWTALQRIVVAGGSIQVFSYLFGLQNEVYDLIVLHRVYVVVIIIGYVFGSWVLYDAELNIQKKKYSQRLKGASLRVPRRKKEQK